MLGNLFRRLTSEPKRGQALFDTVVAEARRPHWYIAGEVADTIDGRFSVLATVAALAIVRLEQGGDALGALSVRLTERFIESMDSEHRELGLNDPGLGRLLMAIGKCFDSRIDAGSTDAWINRHAVVRAGQRLDFDEAAVRATLAAEVVDFEVSLGLGDASATAFGCDLTGGYIDENAAYYSS
jgi:hypothetical protein